MLVPVWSVEQLHCVPLPVGWKSFASGPRHKYRSNLPRSLDGSKEEQLARGDRKGQYRSNKGGVDGLPGSVQDPHPASPAPPTPTNGPSLPRISASSQERIGNLRRGRGGLGRGWGPRADPGSLSTLDSA